MVPRKRKSIPLYKRKIHEVVYLSSINMWNIPLQWYFVPWKCTKKQYWNQVCSIISNTKSILYVLLSFAWTLNNQCDNLKTSTNAWISFFLHNLWYTTNCNSLTCVISLPRLNEKSYQHLHNFLFVCKILLSSKH